MGSAYPDCLIQKSQETINNIKFLFFKNTSTQANWKWGLSAIPRLNIRCVQIPIKRAIILFLWWKLGWWKSWSISWAVLWLRLCDLVLNASVVLFHCEALNIWSPNSFNWATNELKFTGIMMLCQLNNRHKNKLFHSQVSVRGPIISV